MEGFVKSRMTTWMHIFKMSVRPGGEVPLDLLYEMYGKKHDIKEANFIQWLKDVKLKGRLDNWTVVEKDSNYVAEETKVTGSSKSSKEEYDTNTSGEVVARKMGVEDIIQLSVRKARDLVPTLMDVKLLKFALNEARPRPNKESLCRILEKRISELGLPM